MTPGLLALLALGAVDPCAPVEPAASPDPGRRRRVPRRRGGGAGGRRRATRPSPRGGGPPPSTPRDAPRAGRAGRALRRRAAGPDRARSRRRGDQAARRRPVPRGGGAPPRRARARARRRRGAPRGDLPLRARRGRRGRAAPARGRGRSGAPRDGAALPRAPRACAAARRGGGGPLRRGRRQPLARADRRGPGPLGALGRAAAALAPGRGGLGLQRRPRRRSRRRAGWPPTGDAIAGLSAVALGRPFGANGLFLRGAGRAPAVRAAGRATTSPPGRRPPGWRRWRGGTGVTAEYSFADRTLGGDPYLQHQPAARRRRGRARPGGARRLVVGALGGLRDRVGRLLGLRAARRRARQRGARRAGAARARAGAGDATTPTLRGPVGWNEQGPRVDLRVVLGPRTRLTVEAGAPARRYSGFAADPTGCRPAAARRADRRRRRRARVGPRPPHDHRPPLDPGALVRLQRRRPRLHEGRPERGDWPHDDAMQPPSRRGPRARGAPRPGRIARRHALPPRRSGRGARPRPRGAAARSGRDGGRAARAGRARRRRAPGGDGGERARGGVRGRPRARGSSPTPPAPRAARGPPPRIDARRARAAFAGAQSVAFGWEMGDLRIATAYFPIRGRRRRGPRASSRWRRGRPSRPRAGAAAGARRRA